MIFNVAIVAFLKANGANEYLNWSISLTVINSRRHISETFAILIRFRITEFSLHQRDKRLICRERTVRCMVIHRVFLFMN